MFNQIYYDFSSDKFKLRFFKSEIFTEEQSQITVFVKVLVHLVLFSVFLRMEF